MDELELYPFIFQNQLFKLTAFLLWMADYSHIIMLSMSESSNFYLYKIMAHTYESGLSHISIFVQNSRLTLCR